MKMAGTKTIETQRLILRKFCLDDVSDVHKNWSSDEEVQFWYGEPVYKEMADTQKLIEKYVEASVNEDNFRWALCLKDTNKCVGMIAYFYVYEGNNFAEIEYCIGREFQNKGYVTEACEAVIKYGFEEMDLHKVQICHNGENMKSKRVIEKCGFKYEGTLRDYFYMGDEKYVDRLYYSILKSEFNKGKA